MPVPYVAQVPGPTYNTLGDIDGDPIISVEGRERNDVSGNLNLTTVGVPQRPLSLVAAVQGWFDDEVCRGAPGRRCTRRTRPRRRPGRQTGEAFLTSEQAADAVALGDLGYPEKVVVQGVADDSPSDGRAARRATPSRPSTGTPTPDIDALDAVLTAIPGGTDGRPSTTPGSGEPGSATVTTAAGDGRDGSLLGVGGAADSPRRRSTSTSRSTTSAGPRPA